MNDDFVNVEKCIEEFVERMELVPRTSVSLQDIAPEEDWIVALSMKKGPALADSFTRTAFEILERRYPRVLPVPFEILPAVAAHEGWWDDNDGVPRHVALAIYEMRQDDPKASSTWWMVGERAVGEQLAIMRALLEVTLAVIVSAQGHPAYNE